MLCVYIHVQSIQSSFILNFFYKLLHSLKNEQAECGRLSTSLKRTIYTLMLRQYTNSIIALIRGSSQKQSQAIFLHHSKPRCDCFEHDQNNRAYGTIFKYSYTFARHSHCTRTNIRNKSFKIRKKIAKLHSTYDATNILRSTPSILRVFEIFSRVFRIVLRVNGHVVRFDANTIRIHATGCKCSTGGLRVNYELVRKYETDQCFAVVLFF